MFSRFRTYHPAREPGLSGALQSYSELPRSDSKIAPHHSDFRTFPDSNNRPNTNLMKHKSLSVPGGVCGWSYRPDRAQGLLCSLKRALELHHHRTISFAEFGRYSGESGSTVFDRLQRKRHPQIEALLATLERLPAGVRNDLVEKALRCYPTIEHPWISHDPSQVSLLSRILARPGVRGCRGAWVQRWGVHVHRHRHRPFLWRAQGQR